MPSLGLVAQGTVKAPMSCLHSRSMSTGSYSSHEEDGGQAQAPAQRQDQGPKPKCSCKFLELNERELKDLDDRENPSQGLQVSRRHFQSVLQKNKIFINVKS